MNTQGGRTHYIMRMPTRAKKHISKAQRVIALQRIGRQMEAAAMAHINGDLEETGAKRRLDDFEEFQVEDAGAWMQALPWMEGGEMHNRQRQNLESPIYDLLFDQVWMQGRTVGDHFWV